MFLALLLWIGMVLGIHEHGDLIFNEEPITEKTVMYPSNTFQSGQKIYYLYFQKNKIKSEFIRVQVFKAGDTVNRGGYSIYLTKDYRIMQNNMHYYTNYVSIHQPGRYVMQIFKIDDLSKPLAYNEFFVK